VRDGSFATHPRGTRESLGAVGSVAEPEGHYTGA
jgi:hypothetical protein